MKNWIAEFRMSAALDQPSPRPAPRRRAAVQEELQAFEQRLATIDSTLRVAAPRPEPPCGLHGSIMAAVQAPGSRPPRLQWRVLRWGMAGACACLGVLAFWSSTQLLRSRLASSPFTTTASLRLNRQVTALPSAVLSPLTQEWQALNVDLERTADFLLASVP